MVGLTNTGRIEGLPRPCLLPCALPACYPLPADPTFARQGQQVGLTPIKQEMKLLQESVGSTSTIRRPLLRPDRWSLSCARCSCVQRIVSWAEFMRTPAVATRAYPTHIEIQIGCGASLQMSA